jgi:hypothetical protein
MSTARLRLGSSRLIPASAKSRAPAAMSMSAITVRLRSRDAMTAGATEKPISVPSVCSGSSRPATSSDPPRAAQRNGSTTLVLASFPASP